MKAHVEKKRKNVPSDWNNKWLVRFNLFGTGKKKSFVENSLMRPYHVRYLH